MQTNFENQLVNYLSIFINEKINLMEYALKNNIPIYMGNNLDKGWRGNVVEHILNLKKNNKKGSDYEFLEIKTVPVTLKNNEIKVKESTSLSVIDLNDMLKTNFDQSSLLKKINNILFVLIDVSDSKYPYICKTYHFNLLNHPELISKMAQDYEVIANHILDNVQNGLDLDTAFTGRLGEVIQPRPKTGHKGDYIWAFYLKSHVLNSLLNQNKMTIKPMKM